MISVWIIITKHEHNYVHVSLACTRWQVLHREQSSAIQYRYLRPRIYFGAASFCTWYASVLCLLAVVHWHQDFKQLVLLQYCGSIKAPGTWWCIGERFNMLAGRDMHICHSCSHSSSIAGWVTDMSWSSHHTVATYTYLQWQVHWLHHWTDLLLSKNSTCPIWTTIML